MFESLKYSLKHNRKGAMKSVTAWLIFGAIILVFALWGLTPNDRLFGQGGAVATVNDTAISQAQFFDMVDRLQRDPRFQQFEGLGDMGRQFLQSQALNQLVQGELVAQAAQKERIWTSDSEVRDIITSIPAFQEEGRFKREFYMNYLSSVRKTPAEFEEEVRRDQSFSRTVRMFGSAMAPMKIENQKVKALRELKANLDFISISTESLVIPEKIPQADVKTFLAQEGADAKIKGYYESHKESFSTPEQVKVRHILVRTMPNDSASEQAALKKIEDLAKRANAKNFAQLAKEHSEDPGSKDNGGLIDFFSRGRMVPEFEEAAFSLAPNEISKPIKTSYGYHLIQVLEKKAAKESILEDVREEIAATLIARERSQEEIAKLQEALKNGDLNAVQSFVSKHKLKWQETGPFSINSEMVPKIGANDEVIRLAFQLTSEKPLPTSLVREGARSILIRYKSVPVEKKKDPNAEIEAEMFLAEQRGEDSIRAWLTDLRKSARISTNPAFAGGMFGE